MLRRPPGPKPHFLIGNIPLAAADPLGIYRRWADEFGDVFYYRAAWLEVYFLNRPDLIDYVLIRNSQNFLKDRVVQSSRWLLGTGLLTAEGDFWKRQRRLIQPAFSRDRIAAYAGYMSDSAGQMLATWTPDTIIDIHEQMMTLTLRVVIHALFETETKGTEQISRALNLVMVNSIGGKMLLPPFFRQLPLPGMRKLRRAVDQMNAAVYDIIRQRRSAQKQRSADLLSILLAAREADMIMSDQQVRDEVMTFLLAGHETTALTLSWAFYLLDRNPEVERELHQELDHVLGGRRPEFSDLSSLTFCESVVKETMRLYPPAWSVARTTINEFKLEGYRIPAGANIVMSQWIMHRDRRFFSDPEIFRPQRWMTGECDNLPRFAYFPFGGGPRQCIGASFAVTEAVMILATIARKYCLVSTDKSEVQAVPSLTLRPKGPIPMRIVAR